MTQTRKMFVAASDLRPGDVLYKHGVRVATVTLRDAETVDLTYTHSAAQIGSWSASRRFHVRRAA